MHSKALKMCRNAVGWLMENRCVTLGVGRQLGKHLW